MANPLKYTFPSPLAGFENAPPLSDERNEDGKSYVNPQREGLSEAYTKFTEPLDNGQRGGFDIHIYYFQQSKEQTKYARELWERIRREFPELRVYTFWDRPIGPHPVAMFEVNVFTPAQFGAFVSWLAIWRGPFLLWSTPTQFLRREFRKMNLSTVTTLIVPFGWERSCLWIILYLLTRVRQSLVFTVVLFYERLLV
ncbi:hypothetical protein TrVFT333_000130 [Trichoderma virens FT-333]|nr:hypothetical protein TrVFT333_000130 [Trichoderma virens FT-333]